MQLMLQGLRLKNFESLANIIIVLGYAMLLLTGCSTQKYNESEKVGVHKDLKFLKEVTTCLNDELFSVGTTFVDMMASLENLGMTETERYEITNDPFHVEYFRRFSFVFRADPHAIVKYYKKKPPQRGWKLRRGVLLSEFSSSGGDWVAVYENKGELVRVHIYGYNSQFSKQNIPIHKGSLAIERIANFDFINADPASFLGPTDFIKRAKP